MQYLMQAGTIMGMWFIVEYIVFVLATGNILLNFVHTPMMFVTPVLLFFLIRKLRNAIFPTGEFRFVQAFSYGVQLMFFGGLIEAFFIYAYNQWISPGNLLEMRQALLAQYAEVTEMMGTIPNNPLGGTMGKAFTEAQEILAEAPVERPIEAAINALSNDITYGFLWMIPLAFILRRKSQQI